MATDDLFTAADKAVRSNVPEMSVSELAQSLKRTLEDTFGRVRVRGELSGLKFASSGHLYGDIKDAESCINIVCWRGSLSRLSIQPADGLDVIVTGKMTSFPKNSRYQLVIDSMQLAGEGALLKMLEDRKRKLAAEGLFDAERKRPLPFLPDVIGVVTSPTGAVIRDILHRISDRFPSHVIVWPVAVQGDGAAQQIASAIRGFNALGGKDFPRPDLLIVARGGGSLEDLMSFNDEDVVRAAAESRIPLISAVGHETDTTLIDFAADLRAPTPTGAAEKAVPVRLNLLSQILQNQERLLGSVQRQIRELGNRLATMTAKLGTPDALLQVRAQHIDHTASRMIHSFEKGLSVLSGKLAALTVREPRAVLSDKAAALSRSETNLRHAYSRTIDIKYHQLSRLTPRSPVALIDEKRRSLKFVENALDTTPRRALSDAEKRFNHAVRMLESLSYERVLDRGYAVVRREDGSPVSNAADASREVILNIEFKDDTIRVQKA